MGQRIDVLPLQGGFVASGLGRKLIGDDIDLLALQDGKRLGPDVLEGSALGDAVIRKELQHVSSLCRFSLLSVRYSYTRSLASLLAVSVERLTW
jgi:hypothetical protein